MPEQDPLAQLRDIHLPDAISAWPPAPGWWLLLAIIIALLAFGSIYWRNYLQRNRYRKHALHALVLLDRENPSDYLQQLNRLLKQTALAGKPHSDIAGLSGQQWLSFLDTTGGSTDFSQGAAKALEYGPYTPQVSELNTTELQQIAEQWIKQHDLRRSAKPSC
ncbi:DUF4381 domain-containing protein [Oceanicoccus sagamiensis]|uniref:DUF4381 domain-containing protein n=1 Tax=Oceanicoccus sagamiensis TaxID=716816 RepID=A0A1X9NIF6_9GAMM|nr:DUF4381 domain-containing protein [Oceanicoccus sagamiensis]ARN76172.1 hypothetical protein BST96_19945 [Oceanicoccus sagamiensis]